MPEGHILDTLSSNTRRVGTHAPSDLSLNPPMVFSTGFAGAQSGLLRDIRAVESILLDTWPVITDFLQALRVSETPRHRYRRFRQ